MNIKALYWRQLNQERPVTAVPLPVILVLLAAMFMQIAWHQLQPEPQAEAAGMTMPPPHNILELAALGDPVALSKILMFRLQAFDHQPGLSIPFRTLDYQKVKSWLERIAQLDPRAQYPYLAAARVYAEVQDDDKKRIMLEFVYQGFLKNPEVQWPAMTHAVFIAKHRLKDLDLALEYARAIRLRLGNLSVPSWVKQMELFVLEDLGELESARILLGGFVEGGIIKDQQELRFLENRLGIGE